MPIQNTDLYRQLMRTGLLQVKSEQESWVEFLFNNECKFYFSNKSRPMLHLELYKDGLFFTYFLKSSYSLISRTSFQNILKYADIETQKKLLFHIDLLNTKSIFG